MLPFGASLSDVRSKRNEIIKSLHPDKVEQSDFTLETIKQVNQAYEFLKDAERKRRYDSKQIGFDGARASPARPSTLSPPSAPPPPPPPISPRRPAAVSESRSSPPSSKSGVLGQIAKFAVPIVFVSGLLLAMFSGQIASFFQNQADISKTEQVVDCLEQHVGYEFADERFDLGKRRSYDPGRVTVFSVEAAEALQSQSISLSPGSLSFDSSYNSRSMRIGFRASNQSDQILGGLTGQFYVIDANAEKCEIVSTVSASAGTSVQSDLRYSSLAEPFSVKDVSLRNTIGALPSVLDGAERTYIFILNEAYIFPVTQ